jgi:hypothetical protein
VHLTQYRRAHGMRGQSRAAFEGDVRSHGLRVACPGGFDKRSRALLARPLSFKPTAATFHCKYAANLHIDPSPPGMTER